MLPKNFYDQVEKPGFLKHILYGDSVSKDTRIQILQNDKINVLHIESLWNQSSLKYPIEKYNNKEFIHLDSKAFKIEVYDIKNDQILWTLPKYIMRHKIKKQIIRLYFKNNITLDITKKHSIIECNKNKTDLIIKSPYSLSYGLYTPYSLDFLNLNNKNNIKFFNKLKNINYVEVDKFQEIEYDNYVYDFGVPKFEHFFANRILVHNTDSLFITIPVKDSEKLTTEKKLELVDKASNDINNIIQKYLNNYFLPKSNITNEYNSTYFKSELLMSAIMFLDVKKNYAYKLEAKKGKILKTPEVEYTGIQVVRSNAAKLTQNLLRELIETIILNDKIELKEKLPKTSDIVTKYFNNFTENIKNLDLIEISIPGKWSKADQFINGMSLYNFIMKKEIFSMGSAGYFIYCIFKNPKVFQDSNLDMSKVKGIVIPQVYDKELLKRKFEEFQIQIDNSTQWDTLFSTTVDRVVKLVKNLSQK
ncbi:hypothetical protein M0P25_03815 [archaeon]|nr:hypothetical protein [archaeon]